jgi:hypothetical protein
MASDDDESAALTAVVDELLDAAAVGWKNLTRAPRTLAERWAFGVMTSRSSIALQFNGARLSEADAHTLAACLDGDVHTAALYLEYSDLHDGEGAADIVRAATQARALGTLSLAGNNALTYATLHPLLAPRSHGATHELHLSGTALGRDGALDLARWLGDGDCPLRVLNIASCGINGAGATALAEAVETNSRLVTLNLSNNKMGNSPAFPFAEALNANRALATLRLQRVSRAWDTAIGHRICGRHTRVKSRPCAC